MNVLYHELLFSNMSPCLLYYVFLSCDLFLIEVGLLVDVCESTTVTVGLDYSI